MEYKEYIEKNMCEEVDSLSRILKCKSEEQPAVRKKDGSYYPFGEDVHNCFIEFLKIAEDMGFKTLNVDNYGGHIDFEGTGNDGKAPKIVGVIGHLDVVPAGDGWTYPPYEGLVVDGKIYGRGTTDDKGPLMAALYAMKALKDAGYQPINTIRLIVGLDEETNWNGMDYYFEHVRRPDFGFTPDAVFPLIMGEKGICHFKLIKKFGKNKAAGLELRTIKGGQAANQVADFARAVVRNENDKKETDYDSVKEIIENYRKDTGYKVNYKGVGKALEITTTGVSAHGAKPELGLNAISIMMELLSKLGVTNEEALDFIDLYENHIAFELDGSGLGLKSEDSISGSLTLNVGMIDLDSEKAELTLDARYPISLKKDDIFKGLSPILDKYGIGMYIIKDQKPIYMDENSELVKDLMSTYIENTGDNDAKPIIIGGGTYARSTPNIVAFGAQFKDDVDLMHQKDEFIYVDKLKLCTKIYADAIYKLSSKEYN